MKKKIRNLTIEELNKFCDKQYSDGKESCEHCPLCQQFNHKCQYGICAIGDNMRNKKKHILDLEIEVDGK